MNNSIYDRLAAFVGIDWADAKHDACSAPTPTFPSPPSSRIAPRPLRPGALNLQRRFKGRPIAVCLELNNGSLVNALCKYDFFVLFPVNPQSLARYRTLFSSSGAKTIPPMFACSSTCSISIVTRSSPAPSVGPVYAPRLLAAFGEQRHRYPKADDLQQYAGVAPVTERSGNKTWVHWRMSCPKFLRQTFVE